MEAFFECSNKPSATAMMLLKKIREGEPLGPPPRSAKTREPSVDNKGRGRDRRDGSRDRDRARQRWVEDDRRGRDDDRSSQRHEEDHRRNDRSRGDDYLDRD